MFRAIRKLLTPTNDGQARAEAMNAARAKREAAYAEYRTARAAGDTRRMNEAHRSLRHATTDLVRLELGRL